MELRESILEGTLKAFNQKGLKFTMDDLAGILGMSKKTIYTVFRDKGITFLSDGRLSVRFNQRAKDRC